MLENIGVFKHSLLPLTGHAPFASRSHKSEKQRWENTICNPFSSKGYQHVASPKWEITSSKCPLIGSLELQF